MICDICDGTIHITQDLVTCDNNCRYHKKCFKNFAHHDRLYIHIKYKKVPCDCNRKITVIRGMSGVW